MKNFVSLAISYMQTIDWKEIGLFKLCLCSLGVLIGLTVGKPWKKLATFLASMAFITTYVVFMLKFFRYLTERIESDL